MQKVAKSALAVCALVVGAACSDPSSTISPEVATQVAVSPYTLFQTTREKTVDERNAEVAQAAPEFAGVVLGPDGVLELQVAGPPNAAVDERSVAAFRAVFERTGSTRPIRITRVRWSLGELSEARASVENAAEGLLISSDIDEARNRVAFVVRDEAALARVRQLANNLGVRAPSVSVVRGTPPREATTLVDYARPVMGGMQNDMQQTGQTCTLSFALLYYGSGTEYVATNGHCTGTRWAVDNPMILRQPTYWAADYPILGAVGNETVDPALFFGITMCGANRYCRYSDAALFTASSTAVGAKIAQTTYSSSTPGSSGSLTLTSTPFAVSGAWTGNDLYVGMSVNKMGRTTGWTTGAITSTCVRYYQYYPLVPQTHALECQTVASVTLMGGDSGSPVFTINDDGWSVTIAGQVWGAENNYYTDPNNSNNNVYASIIFSSWTNLQTDLGNIYPKVQ